MVRSSPQWLQRAAGTEGVAGAVLTGAALGPVFSSCSPLYAYVVVTVLPAEPVDGLVLLVAYVVGVPVIFFMAPLARRLTARLTGIQP